MTTSMVTREEIKRRVCESIDARREAIIAAGEDIYAHPELGFKERRTAGIVAEHLRGLGIPHETGLALTGVKGALRGAGELTVAYVGELDSVLVRDHPAADPVTGAAHACGHHAQIANLLGVAYGLAESGVMEHLGGNVALMAVPAEEYVELDYRLNLRTQGQIEFLAGKQELIRLGAFDDVDLALGTHQGSRSEGGKFSVGGRSNGCVAKLIRYLGRASHAGGAPHDGINALKAAMLGLQAIDANREKFIDDDHVRVHPIITKGGELVNVVPAEVRLETYVRGASVEAIAAAAAIVDRCLRAGALALGASVEIVTTSGYLPRLAHEALAAVYRENAVALMGESEWFDSSFGAGSTDFGDVSHLMPAIEAVAVGCTGTGHGADFVTADPEMAYIAPAKVAAMTIVDLLANGGERAAEIVRAHQPRFSKEAYLAYVRSLAQETLWNGATG